jgi:hypothetical protein
MRAPHRGRVSYPILKTFLETNKVVAQLDRTGIQQNLQSLYSSLSAYIRSHELPIKLFSREGELYLARLDLDENGDVAPVNIDNFRRGGSVPVGKAPQELLRDQDIPDVDGEVEERFEEERVQVTK